jgi:hypothetical protein
MVVIPASRTPLRPLPFEIFTSNFLPDCWISHIEKSEEEATQMGEMSDATSCALGRREKFDKAINDDHIFGRNGKEKIDVNGSIRKEPAESEE